MAYRSLGSASYKWGYLLLTPDRHGTVEGFRPFAAVLWFRTRKQVYEHAHTKTPPQPYAVVRLESSGR